VLNEEFKKNLSCKMKNVITRNLQVNANLLASKLTSQGKGRGGGNIGHNTRKVVKP
jgi:hypothetical protein